MNERNYGILALILALVALVACSSLWLLMLLVSSGAIGNYESIDAFLWQHSWILYWGWMPGMVLAVAHLLILRRPQNLILKILIWFILSLAIITAIMWLILYNTNIMVIG
jgi:hypothetical protein